MYLIMMQQKSWVTVPDITAALNLWLFIALLGYLDWWCCAMNNKMSALCPLCVRSMTDPWTFAGLYL